MTERDDPRNWCANCDTRLNHDESIRLGMYGTRGCYCSYLCAYTKQPAWVSKEKAAEEVTKRIKSGKTTFKLDKEEEALFLYNLVKWETDKQITNANIDIRPHESCTLTLEVTDKPLETYPDRKRPNYLTGRV